VIDGAQIQNTPVTLRTAAEFSIILPNPGSDIVLEPDRTRALEPGSYGKLHVKSRSKVMLVTGGQYYFKSLLIEPEATLFAENSQGPIFVVVSGVVNSGSAFTFRGKIEKATTQPNLLVTYLGASDALVERPFAGTLLAPNAALHLQVSPVAHKGMFYGKKITVEPDTTVQVETFNPGDCRLNQDACQIGIGCLDEDTNGVLDCRECTEGAAPGCGAPPLPPAAARAMAGAIHLPQGVGLGDFTVAAEAALHLEEGATVEAETDVGPKVLSVAVGAATLASGAEAPGLVAVGGATLLGSSRVDGDVLSVAPSSISASSVVRGRVLSGQPLQPPNTHTLAATFGPSHQGDRLIAGGADRIVWPGHYGVVTIEAGSTAYFKSGEYRFERLLVGESAHIEVSNDAGPVRVLVADQLVLEGSVHSVSDDFPQLVVGYIGTAPTTLAGTFEGTLLVPGASLTIEDGPHRGTFYGHAVTVTAGAHIKGASGSASQTLWPDVTGTPDEIVDRIATQGGLHASTEGAGEVVADSPFKFSVPGRIPVQAGNAGNYPATLEFEVAGGVVTCRYQGGATVSHPTSLLELARGREYGLVGCEGGFGAGDIAEVVRVRLEIEGDPQALGAVTATTLPVGKSCDGYHPDALSPAQSREMIDGFSWPTPDGAGKLPIVAERTQDGRPALYYATVYIKTQADLDFIDRSLMHRLDKPLFFTEWPERWIRECGTIPFEADGVGQWIFVVLPGVTYNRLLEAKNSDEFEQEAKDAIPPILLRAIPSTVRTSEGALKLDILAESGFQYLGLRELPSKEAVLNAALGSAGPGVYPSGLLALISNVFEWIVEAVYDVVNELVIFMGTLQSVLTGTTAITLELGVQNTDPRFESLMRRAWGPNVGSPLAPEGAEVNLRMITQNLLTGFIPLPSHFRGHLDENGLVTLNVARRNWASSSDFQSICIEYGNHAAKLTSFFVPAQICDGSFSDADFGRFQEDSAYVQMDVTNRHLNYFTEMTDAHRYMKEIVGDAPRQAFVTIGTPAWYLAGFNPDKAYAPCLGYGDLFADAVFVAALGPAVATPLLTALAASYLTVLGQTDIVFTDGVWSGDYRGLGTHEYGHFIACHLARRNHWDDLDDLVLTFETFQAGQDPDPGEDTRVVNEAFADFFTGQIAGGTDYYHFAGGLGRPLNDGSGNLAAEGGMVSVASPGLDDNQYWATRNGREAIGRLVTLLQDAFDGHPKGTLAPSSGDAWEIIGTNPSSTISTVVIGPSARSDGDTDLEQVALSGKDINRFFWLSHRARRNPYRETTVEQALADLLTERENWCQKCLVMAPHLAEHVMSRPTSVDGFIDMCLDEPAVAERVGPPPAGIYQYNTATCLPCQQGHGMDSAGACAPCPVDLSLTWGVDIGGACTESWIEQATATPTPNDICPYTFVVEIDNSTSATPALAARVGASTLPTGECALTTVGGTAQFGANPTTAFSSAGTPQLLSARCNWHDPSMDLPLPPTNLRFEVDVRFGGVVPREVAQLSLTSYDPATCVVVK